LGRDNKILDIRACSTGDRRLHIVGGADDLRGEKMAEEEKGEDEIGWVESIRFWSFPMIIIFVVAFILILILRLM
jgi:hypothetical protein